MSTYSYRAKNFSGKEISGDMEAPDVATITARLKADGFIPLEIHGGVAANTAPTPSTKTNALKKIGSLKSIQIFKHVKIAEKMIFSRNLAVMIGAGLPVARALAALAEEAKNPYFKEVIENVNEHVKKGDTLKLAFAAHPDVFPSLYIAMVEAGEQSGKLEESLNVLAKQMKADYELIKRVKGALYYPAVVVTVMIIVGISMMVYVVPTLMSTFDELGVPLPATTRTVMFLSRMLIENGLYMLLALPFLVYGFRRLVKTSRGKRTVDAIFLKLPLLGPIDKKFNTARASRTLGSLLGSGVAITQALEITGHVLQNHFFGDVLFQAKEEIQKGGKMSAVFALHPSLFSSLMAEMIAVGEETGKTADMLGEVASYYEGEVEQTTKDLSGVIEPILMVVVGIGVGFFAVSMIQPLYGVINAL